LRKSQGIFENTFRQLSKFFAKKAIRTLFNLTNLLFSFLFCSLSILLFISLKGKEKNEFIQQGTNRFNKEVAISQFLDSLSKVKVVSFKENVPPRNDRKKNRKESVVNRGKILQVRKDFFYVKG